MITLVIGLFILAVAGVSYLYFLDSGNQGFSGLELQRDGGYAMEVMANSIRKGGSFEISDYGTETDNQIIITGGRGFYQDTAADPVDLKNDNSTPDDIADDITIIPQSDNSLSGIKYSVIKLLFTSLNSTCVRIDMELKARRKEYENTASFTSTVHLRN